MRQWPRCPGSPLLLQHLLQPEPHGAGFPPSAGRRGDAAQFTDGPEEVQALPEGQLHTQPLPGAPLKDAAKGTPPSRQNFGQDT